MMRHEPDLEHTLTLPVLVNKEHPEVVGESCKNSFVGFEEDISDGHSAVTQEAKLPLSVKLLQQDKTMIGQLHSSTCKHTRYLQLVSCLEEDRSLLGSQRGCLTGALVKVTILKKMSIINL